MAAEDMAAAVTDDGIAGRSGVIVAPRTSHHPANGSEWLIAFGRSLSER
jgi:hypothetical protein